MTQEPQKPEEPAVEEEPIGVLNDDHFTFEKGKERAAEAVERVKQAGREVTTRPILDAIGSYFTRGVDALIGLADGMSGKRDLRDTKKDRE